MLSGTKILDNTNILQKHIHTNGGGADVKNQEIRSLAQQAAEAMVSNGYQPRTAWTEHSACYQPIVIIHEQRGVRHLDKQIVAEFMEKTTQRYEAREISYTSFRRLVHGAERLVLYSETGSIEKRKPADRAQTNSFFESLVKEICFSNSWSDSTQRGTASVMRQHFAWLCSEGYPDLNQVNGEVLRRYLLYCAGKYSGGTVACTKSRLKQFYSILAEKGQVTEDYAQTFSFPVAYAKKIRPAALAEDVSMSVEKVDRTIPMGKRDYAVMLLGIVTGLRAVDIANLRLRDIDWKRGEIRLTQHKTGVPLVLPLTRDVGAALQDYILHGRITVNRQVNPEIDHVFIASFGPAKNMTRHAIGDIYSRYRLQAGLREEGFHALRRAVGRNMAMAEVPLTTITQVLGHSTPDVTKQYLMLDSVHLKECALDFGGIEVKGGVYYA